MSPEAPVGELWRLGVAGLSDGFRAGRFSPVEVAEAVLERAESTGSELRAFTALDADAALEDAGRATRELARGAGHRPLLGVPFTVKDLIRTRGLPTTGGSRALGDGGLPGDRDAHAVAGLRRAGAVLIGKTNLNEFAYGVTGENEHYGRVLNPWSRERMTGGSSAGSAAALAAGIGAASVGTDTRGSIRIPASCCAVTGFKPTRHLVPTDGLLPLSPSLDHVGPMARSVEDVALLLGAMTKPGNLPEDYAPALERSVEGLTLGLCRFFFEGLEPEVEAAVRTAVETLVELGLRVREVEVPELEESLEASGVIAAAEAAAVHEDRVRDRRQDFGEAMLRRLEKGYDLGAVELVRGRAAAERLREAYRKTFEEVDCMAGPTLPGLPARADGSTMTVASGREEWVVDASCRLNAPQNVTGAPAISVPCGFSGDELPIGLQIWAAPGDDETVLAVAHRYQQATGWHDRWAPSVLPQRA